MQMVSAAERKHWTVADYMALPDDGKRYEVIDGELFVTPAPIADHQRLVFALGRRLATYLDAAPVGEVLLSPADIEFAADTVVQPDVFVAPLVGGARPRSWKDITGLLLAAEVLSTSTRRVDRTVKRRRYQRAGVAEYWIVDGDARLVERWRAADERPEILSDELVWQPDAAHESLRIDLPAFFASALDG